MGTISRTTSLVTLDGAFTKGLAVATGKVPLAVSMSDVYTNGSGSRLVNQYFQAKVTSAGATAYVLNDGTMTDDYGDAITFTAIHLILLRNLSTTKSETVTVSGNFLTDATAPSPLGGTTPTILVPGGGKLLLENPLGGWVPVAVSGDDLVLTPSTSLTWELHILGTV